MLEPLKDPYAGGRVDSFTKISDKYTSKLATCVFDSRIRDERMFFGMDALKKEPVRSS